MNINFHYTNVKASNRLEILTAEKINKLIDKFDFIVSADAFLKKENTSNPNAGFVCNIKLNTPGSILFAEASNSSFEISIADAAADLDRQLQKRKAKMKSY